MLSLYIVFVASFEHKTGLFLEFPQLSSLAHDGTVVGPETLPAG